MRNEHEITQEVAAGRIGDALRKYVGRGQRYSFATLSEKTGISKRSLESYVYEDNAPRADALLTLFSVLGPAFASEVLGVCGMVAKDETEDPAEYAQAMTALCNMGAGLAAALEDGRVDHREQAALRPQAAKLVRIFAPIARIDDLHPNIREVS